MIDAASVASYENIIDEKDKEITRLNEVNEQLKVSALIIPHRISCNSVSNVSLDRKAAALGKYIRYGKWKSNSKLSVFVDGHLNQLFVVTEKIR